MRNGLVLAASAAILGLSVVAFGDDFKSWFYQFNVATAELWKTCCIWLAPDACRPQFLVQPVTAMGQSRASLLAQGTADLLTDIVEDRFDAEEAVIFCDMYEAELAAARAAQLLTTKGVPFDATGTAGQRPFAEWLTTRFHLTLETQSNQCRLYHFTVYTDDSKASAAGTPRAVRLVQCWRRVCLDANAKMATAQKRNAGCIMPWLGHFHDDPDCVLLTEEHKCLRAVDVLRRGCDGQATAEEWRNNNQLLQHLLPLRQNDKRAMYQMWDVVSGLEPNRRIPEGRIAAARDNINGWIQTLLHTPAVKYEDACTAPSTTQMPRGRVFYIYTDAAGPDCPQPGLGGYLGGYYFALALERSDVEGPARLPISVWELAAIGVAILTLAGLTAGGCACLSSDSSSSINPARADAAHVALMQYVHQRITGSAEYRRMCHDGLYMGHVWGDANPFGDLPSRGRFQELEELCCQLGVRAERVPVPPVAERFVADIRLFANNHRAEHATALAAPQPFTADQDGPPWLDPLPNFAPPAKRRRAVRGVDGDGATQTALRPCVDYELDFVPPAPRRSRSSTVDSPIVQRAAAPPRAAVGPVHADVPSLAPADDARSASKAPRLRVAIEDAFDFVPPAIKRQQRADVAASSNPPDVRRRAAADGGRFVGNRLLPLAAGTTDAAIVSLDLRPLDDDWYQGLLARGVALRAQTYAESTNRTGASHWRKWEVLCALMGTSPYRTDFAANSGQDRDGYIREVTLACAFVLERLRTIRPRASLSVVANPESVNNSWLAVRREHAQKTGVEMVTTKEVRHLIRGLCREYVNEHGHDCLVTKCKEPLRRRVQLRLLTTPNGTRVADRVVDWTAPFWVMWRAWICVMSQTGFRKNETSLPNNSTWTRSRIARASLTWRVRGVDVASLTDPQLRALQPGDYAVLKPPAAKNDPFCLIFGDKPIYLPFDAACPFNAAAALRNLELVHPLAPPQRRDTPLFTVDGEPLRHGVVDKTLRAHLRVHLTPEEADTYSAHSFRIGLACALLALGRPHSLIQALLRWKGDGALRQYARLNAEDYGRHITEATAVNVTSVTTAHLPRIDYDDVVARCHSFVANRSPPPPPANTASHPESRTRDSGDPDLSEASADS
ncbi:MAG: hypothetical protein AAGF99_15835 [Bacteroidota bacterium]